MKNIRFSSRTLAGLSVGFVFSPALLSAQLNWSGSVPGPVRNGNWDIVTNNWDPALAAPVGTVPWVNGPFIANFNNIEGGTVTVTAPVTVDMINAGLGGAYTITGGTITASMGLLAVDVGNTGSGLLNIGSTLSAPVFVAKMGLGTLNFTGTIDSSLAVSQGLMILSGDNIANTGTISVTDFGTVQLNGNDTVATYRGLGGTLSGAGTLTVTGVADLQDGATVSGKLSGNTTSDGAVLVSGTIGGGTLNVNGGLTNISGTFNYPVININTGQLSLSGAAATSSSTNSTVNVGAGTVFDNTATNVVDFGLFGTSALVGSGGTISGAGLTYFRSVTLTGDTLSGNVAAFGVASLNNGTLISGNLLGATINTNGNVSVTGLLGDGILTRGGLSVNVSGGITRVVTGTLTLSGAGQLTSLRVNIAGPAILDNQNGGLATGAAVTNAGTLDVDVNDTVTSYTSDGGLLSGAGTLTVTGVAELNNGSTVSGKLSGNTQTNGTVGISGTAGGGTLTVNSGTLTITGATNYAGGTFVNDGTLLLNGAGPNTAISSGVLTVGDSSGAGLSAVVEILSGAQIADSVNVVVNSDGKFIAQNDQIADLTVNGGLVDTAITGLGVLGTITLNSGTIQGVAVGAYGGQVNVIASGVSSVISAGIVDLAPGGVTINVANGAAANDLVISGVVSGGPIVFTGAGTLALTNGGNTYAGGTSINGGTLHIGATGATGFGTITVLGSTIDYANGVNEVNPIDLHANVDLNVDGGAAATQTGAIGETGGPFGITKTGGGQLTLAGPNTYTGATNVSLGTLALSGSLTSTTLGISIGAVFDNQAAGLAAGTVVTNAGTLDVDVNDTVSSYISDGGLLSGAGTLTATGAATLNNNSTISGNLVALTISTNDAVLVSGTIGGGGLSVNSGTLTLTGSSTNPTVSISAGSTLLDNGNLGDAAAIFNNSSTLTVNVNDTVGAYTSSGLLDGTGTLTVTGVATLNDGSTVSGSLSGNTQTSGAVGITGTAAGGTLDVNGGLTNISGTFNYPVININAGQLSLSGAAATSTNTTMNVGAGTVFDNTATNAIDFGFVGTGALVGSGGTISGAGLSWFESVTLTGDTLSGNAAASTVGLNGGTLISGNLLGSMITTNGNVSVTGLLGDGTLTRGTNTVTILGGTTTVATGTLTLSGAGQLTSLNLNISGPAILDDQNAGIIDTAAVTNAGTLNVTGSDTVTSYTSNGGLLSGAGTLTAATYDLNDLSVVSGNLGNGTLNANGTVTYSGTSMADVVNIQSGITSLTGGGQFGMDSSLFNISGGARLNLGGTDYRFTTIQGSGTVGGNLLIGPGDSLFPGTVGTLGTFTVDGNLTIQGAPGNSGNLGIDVFGTAPGTFDRVLVTGNFTLGANSSLVVNNPGGASLAAPVDIVDFATQIGNFTTTNLALAFPDAAHVYNPATGQIIPGPATAGEKSDYRVGNLNGNQSAAFVSLWDDVVDFGFQNVIQEFFVGDTNVPLPPGTTPTYGDTFRFNFVAPGSTLIQDGDAQLRTALNLVLAGDGMGNPYNGAVMNLLLPEVHQGLGDFTEQSMRGLVRLATRTAPVAEVGKGSVFAAVHSSTGGSSVSENNADYDVKMNGAVAGVRYEVMPGLRLGAMLGYDDGSIEGSLIDTDGNGMMFGLFGEYVVNPDTGFTVFSSLAYGDYEYDSARRSFGGLATANGIGSDALEFAIGVQGVAWQKDNFRLIPMAALRYLTGDVDGFTETGPGVPLRVNGYDIDSLLLELGIDAELDLNEVVTLLAHVGFVTDFEDSGNSIGANFVNGARPYSVLAPGIDDEAFVLGVGATFDVTEALKVGLNWRSELRDSSQSVHSISLGGSYGF